MAHVTKPFVFYDEDRGAWKCLMRDSTGKTWGTGYGETRQSAIYKSRQDQPHESVIRKAIGWVNRHPFLAGAALGVYLSSRSGFRGRRPALGEYALVAFVTGSIAWAIQKAAKLAGKLIMRGGESS